MKFPEKCCESFAEANNPAERVNKYHPKIRYDFQNYALLFVFSKPKGEPTVELKAKQRFVSSSRVYEVFCTLTANCKDYYKYDQKYGFDHVLAHRSVETNRVKATHCVGYFLGFVDYITESEMRKMTEAFEKANAKS